MRHCRYHSYRAVGLSTTQTLASSSNIIRYRCALKFNRRSSHDTLTVRMFAQEQKQRTREQLT
jgi:hypothetical protein